MAEPKKVIPRNPRERETRIVKISDLVPYECGTVGFRYEGAKQCLREGKQPKQILVRELSDGKLLITDGTNTTKAAFELGHREVEVAIQPTHDSSELVRYERVCRHRWAEKFSWDALPAFESDEARDEATLEEETRLAQLEVNQRQGSEHDA